MAKTGFWLRGAKGKLAGTTIYKGKTGTIQREIVSPSNPQSEGQMTQRSRFLSAVRFYQRSNQRFFKMAFEGKRQGESDFNAFMRHNAKLGPYITKAQGDAIGFPMFAPWIVTQGSLVAPKQNTIYEGVEGSDSTRFGLSICPVSEYSGDLFPETIGELATTFFEHNPEMRENDILTFVTIDANIAGEDYIEDLDAQGMQTSEPSWFIRQIVLDSADNTRLASLGLSVVMLGEQEDDPDLCVTTTFDHAVEAYHAGAGVVVLSRNTSSGLKVSNSVLALNDTAYNVYNAMRSNSYLQKVLAWWGAQQQAILQGSVAENKQQKVSAKVTLIGGQRPVAELSYSAGQAKSVGITFDSDPVGVTADNFIVEGEGVTKTYSNSILTLTFANPGEYSIKFGSQKIAVAAVEVNHIEGAVLAGARSCTLNSKLNAPFAVSDGTRFILAMTTFGSSSTVIFENLELTANEGTISGQTTGDIVNGTITLNQNVSADGTIQFAIESNADFSYNTAIRLGMVVGDTIVYNDSFTTPMRKVVAENAGLEAYFHTMGIPSPGVFEDGDKVVISVDSEEKSGLITFDQFVPDEEEPSLKSTDNILGVELSCYCPADEYDSLSIGSIDGFVLGFEATLKVVSITRSGVEYPIVNK